MEYVQLGEKLGLQGTELQEFVDRKEREYFERMERAAEREARKIESEIELEKLKKETELQKLKAGELAVGPLGLASQSLAKLPKLPPFDESKDCIDSYLQRFERFASCAKWEQSSWAINLSALLKGKALEVYSRLPVSEALNYGSLKQALLRRFQLTEKGFRVKFRSSRPEQGENPSQFFARLNNYVEKWLSLADSPKTYDGLKDLCLREQFLNSCSKQLGMYLKERHPKNVEEMSNLADQFIEAHGYTSFTKDLQVFQRQPPSISSVQGNSSGSFQKQQAYQGSPQQNGERKCYICGKSGHLARNCFSKQKIPRAVPTSHNTQKAAMLQNQHNCELNCIKSNDNSSSSLQNSAEVKTDNAISHQNQPHIGSACILKHKLLQCCVTDGLVKLACGHILPVIGGVCKVCEKMPVAMGYVGNIDCAKNQTDPDPQWCRKDEREECSQVLQAVQTRNQKKKEEKGMKKLRVTDLVDTDMTIDQMKQLQMDDSSLKVYREHAATGRKKNIGENIETWFSVERGLLYRHHYSKKVSDDELYKQLVVPESLRQKVMKIAHDSILGGHLGTKKTLDRIMSNFYWPGIQGDVTRYCQSCDICQRTFPKGKVTKVPLEKMPLIDTPFERVAVDLVGPLSPITDKGNRYILTVVDYSTRYPEAVALKNIDTETVAEALVEIFSRVGIPKEVLSDMGTQFTSNIMKEVGRLLSFKQLVTTPYHPACNGLVEKFNGTLKSMLRKMSSERPKDWDRYLPALLFAYREVPQESTKFSPFDLVYARNVRGPMAVLKELWTKEEKDPEVKTTYQYVLDLKERLARTCELAQKELQKSKDHYKKQYDKRTKPRSFKVGDFVLLLLPTDHNKLLMQWKGPFKVVDRKGQTDYQIDMNGHIRLFHANLLKKYNVREERNTDSPTTLASCVVLESEETEDSSNEHLLHLLPMKATESFTDVKVNHSLSSDQLESINDVLHEFQEVLTDLPGRTNVIQHEVHLTTKEPIRNRPYQIPYAVRSAVREEIQHMIDMDIIEPSESPYASSIVVAKKSYGSQRICVDFRNLNKANEENSIEHTDIFNTRETFEEHITELRKVVSGSMLLEEATNKKFPARMRSTQRATFPVREGTTYVDFGILEISLKETNDADLNCLLFPYSGTFGISVFWDLRNDLAEYHA
ncbi:uncharacterized protein LOC134263457 [Saccostrea cucullata]|uniref:uncharacterized protein LOC134263457 n=1 Tax=Saccostrea cuccullata TaxID=36930 RepID=UPI002ED3157B